MNSYNTIGRLTEQAVWKPDVGKGLLEFNIAVDRMGPYNPETKETEALDPGALEHKYYAAGSGNVLVVDVVTGERLELVTITTS